MLAVTHDYNQPEVELFSLRLGRFVLVSNKKADLKVDVVFNSNLFEGIFGSTLMIPPKYCQFIQVPLAQDSIASSKMFQGTGFNGNVSITPEGKKEIEFIFEKANIIVFSFLIRFIVELLTLDDVKEHPGFEETKVSVTGFLLRIKDAELCLVSNEESCLVVKSNNT